jgi:uroporphyrin-3 C-methyltransferase
MSQSDNSLPQTTSDEPRADTAAGTPAEAPAEAPEPEAQRAPRLPVVFALLALGISIGLAVGGYFMWTQLQQLTGAQAAIEPRLEQKVQPLQNNLQVISNDWQAGRREIEQQLAALGDRQAALAERVSKLASLLGRSEHGWTLAEVEYLLRIASDSLQLRRDRRTAIAALKSADTRLRELADPQLLPVREQLARELNRLREVPEVDFDGISLRLADDLQQIDSLPVAGSRYEPPKPETTQFDATRTARDWRDLPQVIWSALKELFRVREHDKPVGPMLPPDRVWFLKENLRLQLAAARLALLREDRQAYRQALLTADSWLKEWFDTRDPAVTAMSAGLEELAAVDIRPDMPDVSESLQLLRQLQKRQEMLAGPEASKTETDGAENTGTVSDETVPPPVEETLDRPESKP